MNNFGATFQTQGNISNKHTDRLACEVGSGAAICRPLKVPLPPSGVSRDQWRNNRAGRHLRGGGGGGDVLPPLNQQVHLPATTVKSPPR